MKKTLIYTASFVVAVVLLAACSASKPSFTVKTDEGYLLRYQDVAKFPVNYTSNSQMDQFISSPMGDMEVNVMTSNAFTLTGAKAEGENVNLEITMDKMGMIIDSPQESMDQEIKEVEGKSFTMVINPLGKETDYSGAKEVTYTYSGAKRSLAGTFLGMFADLPEKRVQVGDSWETSDDITYSDGAENIKMTSRTQNTLMGIEELMGYKVARIDYTGTGTREATGAEMGMQMSQKADMEISGTLYFAFEEGIIVMDEMTATMEGDLSIDTPQGAMDMPLSVDMDMTTKIKK